MGKKQTAQPQSDMTPAGAAGQRLTSERLFFCSAGVSLHSGAAQTGSACLSTHTTLLPSTLLRALLIYSPVYHANPPPQTGKRFVSGGQAGRQAGRPESFLKNGMWRKYGINMTTLMITIISHLEPGILNRCLSFFLFFCLRLHNNGDCGRLLESGGAGANVHTGRR